MFDVDVMVTWVDGSDAAHCRKRAHFIELSGPGLHENAITPHRWADGNELRYCLRSIELNAPWVRRIWLVTDNQIPDLAHLARDFRAKIQIVDHVEIFDEFSRCLPTFSSLTIESMMWRIPELSEHFIYFNDDVFLTAPVAKTDFFENGGPVLRGKWVNFSELRVQRTDAGILPSCIISIISGQRRSSDLTPAICSSAPTRFIRCKNLQ